MMTTVAALFGGLPLALMPGTGSEMRRPLGISIVGGLMVSQALTLYTTPVIYLYMDRLQSRLRRRKEAGFCSGSRDGAAEFHQRIAANLTALFHVTQEWCGFE